MAFLILNWNRLEGVIHKSWGIIIIIIINFLVPINSPGVDSASNRNECQLILCKITLSDSDLRFRTFCHQVSVLFRANSYTDWLLLWIMHLINTFYKGTLDSSVGIATMLRAGQPGFRIPAGQDFSLRHSVEIGSGSHPASYQMYTGGTFSGVKRPGREAEHHLVPRTRMEELYLHSHIRLLGVVLN
jgi:hypothetical protein